MGKKNRKNKRRGVPRSVKEKSEKTYLRSYNTITSTAGGVISPIYASSDPFTLSVQGFSQFAGLYRNYRVRKIIVQYMPIASGAVNNVLIMGSPLIHGSTRAPSAPVSYSNVQGDQGATLTAANMPFVHKISAILPEELLFVSTGATITDVFAVEIYGSGYAASTTYGSTLVTYQMEFVSRYF